MRQHRGDDSKQDNKQYKKIVYVSKLNLLGKVTLGQVPLKGRSPQGNPILTLITVTLTGGYLRGREKDSRKKKKPFVHNTITKQNKQDEQGLSNAKLLFYLFIYLILL